VPTVLDQTAFARLGTDNWHSSQRSDTSSHCTTTSNNTLYAITINKLAFTTRHRNLSAPTSRLLIACIDSYDHQSLVQTTFINHTTNSHRSQDISSRTRVRHYIAQLPEWFPKCKKTKIYFSVENSFRPQEPILFPKLRIYFADFPYLHYSTRLEATHLGDLLRIRVRLDERINLSPSIFTDAPNCTIVAPILDQRATFNLYSNQSGVILPS